MNEEDVKKIAKQMVEEIRSDHHDFWIDPQDHYDQHKELSTILEVYRNARNSATKVIVGLLILGGLLIAAFAAGLGKVFGK